MGKTKLKTGFSIVTMTGIILATPGCATIEKRASEASPGLTAPAGEAVEASQLGVLNAAADDLTGVSINTALPAGIVIVLLLNIYLSHRREMTRIRHNGHGGPNGSPDKPGNAGAAKPTGGG